MFFCDIQWILFPSFVRLQDLLEENSVLSSLYRMSGIDLLVRVEYKSNSQKPFYILTEKPDKQAITTFHK